MRKIIFILALISVAASSIGQSFQLYRIYNVPYPDTIYLRNDSLFNKLPDGTYAFAYLKPFKTIISADQVTGVQIGLVSGENIKTINNVSILGSGNIAIAGGEAFPVGSVFISIVATNPNTLLGYGTWAAFAAGRMLVGFDSGNPNFDVAEETGGNSSVTISTNNLPELSVDITDPGHTHVQNKNTATNGGLSGTTPDASTNTSAASGYSTASATTGITATANTGGANNAINILNPYITVFMWVRQS